MFEASQLNINLRDVAYDPSLRADSDPAEEGRLRGDLARALASYILKSQSKPCAALFNDLLEIEMCVGEFVGEVLKRQGVKKDLGRLRGTLAGAVSLLTPLPPHGPNQK